MYNRITFWPRFMLKGECRFSGFGSPVDSTGIQTPDLVASPAYCRQAPRNDNGAELAEPVVDEVEEDDAHDAGAGDGEDPGPHDSAGDSPVNGGEAARCANAGNSSGDDVS